MKIQNIKNPKFTQEITRKEWNELGKRQAAFRVIDENDKPAIKEPVLVNTVKTPPPADNLQKKNTENPEGKKNTEKKDTPKDHTGQVK